MPDASSHQEEQLELFEGYFPEAKGPRSPNPIKVPQKTFLLHLTLEKAILLGMVGVLLLAGVFALGVFRGKSLTRQNFETGKLPLSRVLVQTPTASERMTVAASPALPAVAATAATVSPAHMAKSAGSSKVYFLQLASCRKKEAADSEMEYLYHQGYQPFVYQSGNFYLVCVGDFTKKTEAEQAKNALRGRYQDLLLRSR